MAWIARRNRSHPRHRELRRPMSKRARSTPNAGDRGDVARFPGSERCSGRDSNPHALSGRGFTFARNLPSTPPPSAETALTRANRPSRFVPSVAFDLMPANPVHPHVHLGRPTPPTDGPTSSSLRCWRVIPREAHRPTLGSSRVRFLTNFDLVDRHWRRASSSRRQRFRALEPACFAAVGSGLGGVQHGRDIGRTFRAMPRAVVGRQRRWRQRRPELRRGRLRRRR